MRTTVKTGLTILLSVMLLLLSACSDNQPGVTNTGFPEDSDSIVPSYTSETIETSSNDVSSENSEVTVSYATVSSKPSTTYDPTGSEEPTVSSEPSQYCSSEDCSQQNATFSENDTTVKVDNVPEIPILKNRRLAANAEEAYGYSLGGELVNWIVADNKVYSILKNPNALCVFSTEEKDILIETLPGAAYEIRIYNGKIYVSFPTLNLVKIYNINTLKQTGQIKGINNVSSFCLDGNMLYYSGHNHLCDVFRYNIITGEKTPMKGCPLMNCPKLEINREAGLLYVGESGFTGSKLYYFNLDDLTIHSVFSYDNCGYHNENCSMYVINGFVYWGEFKISGTDATDVVTQYHQNSNASVMFANDDVVCFNTGIFDEQTGRLLIDFTDLNLNNVQVLITKNNTLVNFVDNYDGQSLHMAVCVPM